jgi:hypothetical protein
VSNPSLAIWLYIAILLMAFMFSPRWGRLVSVITTGTKAKA